ADAPRVTVESVMLRVLYLFVFFFSSTRRHTSSKRDWSSDVCSSDLNLVLYLAVVIIFGPIAWLILTSFKPKGTALTMPPEIFFKIGRASCREREKRQAGPGALKIKSDERAERDSVEQ